jgi:hypothetical protein
MSNISGKFKYDPYTIAAVLKAVHSFPPPQTDIPYEGIAEILRTGIEPALRDTIEDMRHVVIELIAELALEEADEPGGGFEAPSFAFVDELEGYLSSEPGQGDEDEYEDEKHNRLTQNRVGTTVFTLFARLHIYRRGELLCQAF